MNWMTKKLVPEARNWWRLASVQIALLTSAITATLTANPELVIGMVTILPVGPAKYLVAAAAGVLVFAVPTAARLINQTEEPDDASGE